MHYLIEKFLESNNSNDSVKQRINIFNAVREYSYQINDAKSPEQVIEFKAGYCVSKHRLLKVLYDSLGCQTRLCFIPFSFNDIYLPENLQNRGFANKKWYHVFLQVFLNDSRIDIDASFNDSLSKYYVVNRNRDWFSSQKVIVNYDEFLSPNNKQEEHEIKKRFSDPLLLNGDDEKRISEFNNRLLFLGEKE